MYRLTYRILLPLFAAALTPVHAESTARSAGKALGEFGNGFGEAIGSGMSRGIHANQPHWITINPSTKKDCLAESGGTVNNVYMRCRRGRQEYVRFDQDGRKLVLRERAIPGM